MRLVIAHDVRRLPSMWEGYSLMVLLGAALYFPFWLTGMIELPLESPLRLLGLACPLCGGSRAVGSLVLGHVQTAIQYNPLALVLFAAMLWGAFSYFFMVLPFRRRVQLDASKAQTRAMWIAIALVFVANWAYVLASGMYRVPMEH